MSESDSSSGPSDPGCFEDRLLRELQAFAATRTESDLEEPARRSRRPMVAVAAIASVLAGGAVVVPTVLLGNHGARSAYAVQRQGNGKVSLEIQGVIATPADMERDLNSAGAPVKVVPARTGGCRSAPIAAPAGLLSRTGPETFVIDPHKIPHGTTLVAQVPVAGHRGPLRLSLSADPTRVC